MPASKGQEGKEETSSSDVTAKARSERYQGVDVRAEANRGIEKSRRDRKEESRMIKR